MYGPVALADHLKKLLDQASTYVVMRDSVSSQAFITALPDFETLYIIRVRSPGVVLAVML